MAAPRRPNVLRPLRVKIGSRLGCHPRDVTAVWTKERVDATFCPMYFILIMRKPHLDWPIILKYKLKMY